MASALPSKSEYRFEFTKVENYPQMKSLEKQQTKVDKTNYYNEGRLFSKEKGYSVKLMSSTPNMKDFNKFFNGDDARLWAGATKSLEKFYKSLSEIAEKGDSVTIRYRSVFKGMGPTLQVTIKTREGEIHKDFNAATKDDTWLDSRNSPSKQKVNIQDSVKVIFDSMPKDQTLFEDNVIELTKEKVTQKAPPRPPAPPPKPVRTAATRPQSVPQSRPPQSQPWQPPLPKGPRPLPPGTQPKTEPKK